VSTVAVTRITVAGRRVTVTRNIEHVPPILTVDCINHLRRAKRNLARDVHDLRSSMGRNRFVCYAIRDTTFDNERSRVVAEYLRSLIMARLNGFSTLDGWFARRVPISLHMREHDWPSYFQRTQETRRRWIDALILEAETRGTL
jgi:hypothetical protein